MHITASASSLPQESYNYSPEELESMRHAFRRACDENPSITIIAEMLTDAERADIIAFLRTRSDNPLLLP